MCDVGRERRGSKKLKLEQQAEWFGDMAQEQWMSARWGNMKIPGGLAAFN